MLDRRPPEAAGRRPREGRGRARSAREPHPAGPQAGRSPGALRAGQDRRRHLPGGPVRGRARTASWPRSSPGVVAASLERRELSPAVDRGRPGRRGARADRDRPRPHREGLHPLPGAPGAPRARPASATSRAPPSCWAASDGADAVAWSKAALADALVRGGRPGPRRRRRTSPGPSRSASSRPARPARDPAPLVSALARAELHARGRESRLGADTRVGVARERPAPPGSPAARRGAAPRIPRPSAGSLGEAVLAQYVLDEVIPAPTAEAHRLGDLHLYDLGRAAAP